jgi:carnosine N-methyltransferase
MDPALQRLVPGVPQKFAAIKQAVLCNQHFLDGIVAESSHMFANQDLTSIQTATPVGPVPERDLEKMRSTFKSLMREWSSEGAEERARCYQPFLDELMTRFPNPQVRKNVSVLSPGCGLGRLPWELVARGFISQGNEFSFFMLLTSSVVLNSLPSINCATIYPFVHEVNNVREETASVKGMGRGESENSIMRPFNSTWTGVALSVAGA